MRIGADQQSAEFEVCLVDGETWFAVHAVPGSEGISIFFRDITEARRARDRIEFLAHHDALTGVPNRALFLETLDTAIKEAVATGSSVGVIYLDLDDFKTINDTLGHHAGDALLTAAANRIQAVAAGTSHVARIGGDEFAVLQHADASPKSLELLAGRLRTALAEPFPFMGTKLSCKASLGLALYPDSDHRPAELMKNADLALYEAKRAGGNQIAFFNPTIRQAIQHRASALSCARDALARDAVLPFYQPKVSLKTGNVIGFEALLRWVHPRDGVQPPGSIKEAFEDPLLSLELGQSMIDGVLRDMQNWQKEKIGFGSVAINLSTQQFLRTDVANSLITALQSAGLPQDSLEVEVTETVFLGEGSEAVGLALDLLHSGGICISLDDFGTGFASLTHLHKFPVSWLKIDRSFISDMESDPDAASIVDGVIRLSHSLGIQVVAEGVETLAQWQALKMQGCDVAQGYFIAKPMPAQDVSAFLSNWSAPTVPFCAED